MSRPHPLIDALGGHPFPRLAALLAGLVPGAEPVDMTIGEPRTPPPAWMADALAGSPARWAAYPPNDGPEWFREAAAGWLERRFGLPVSVLTRDAVVPTAGAREAIVQLGIVAARDSARKVALMPTPHYAPYRAAALVAGLTPSYLPARAPTFLPDLDDVERLAPGASLLVLCSPSNPEGAVATRAYWHRAIEIARRNDLLLVADECYSEIYRGEPPTGVLEACLDLPSDGDPFRGVVAVNSLSKRSGAAGLRVGFVAGDREVVSALVRLRAYMGGTTVVPGLSVAAALLSDEEHVGRVRDHYRASFDVADEVLGDLPGWESPRAGMFLWLPSDSPVDLVREAWTSAGVRVLPGEFLGPPGDDGDHPGAGRVRVAMVHAAPEVETAMRRLRPTLQEWMTTDRRKVSSWLG